MKLMPSSIQRHRESSSDGSLQILRNVCTSQGESETELNSGDIYYRHEFCRIWRTQRL